MIRETPEASEGPYDRKWAMLFLPEARPIRPDDHLLARSRMWRPPAWLVLAVMALDLAAFAYVYSQI